MIEVYSFSMIMTLKNVLNQFTCKEVRLQSDFDFSKAPDIITQYFHKF